MNKERILLNALKEVLEGVTIQYAEGDSEPFVGVRTGSIDDTMGYPVAGVIPLGPQFASATLGNQSMNRKARYVALTVEIHYEHHDKEAGVERMSDILWCTVEAILEHPNLGGADGGIELGEIDYAYRIQDEEKDRIPDWGYKGVALIPLIGTYRYR